MAHQADAILVEKAQQAIDLIDQAHSMLLKAAQVVATMPTQTPKQRAVKETIARIHFNSLDPNGASMVENLREILDSARGTFMLEYGESDA